jgi:type I restriction enzyme R subunit
LPEGQLAEEDFEAKGLDKSSRDFLDEAIKDYNTMFGVNYNTGDQFENYYKDISHRLKNRDLDMVIVVNMFLTGFDATTLNTLWVDKKLRSHGLIQAFSRTNRILNSVKSFGNIVCFRNLEKPTEEAIALFGDKEAAGIVVLKPFDEYYGDYEKRIAELVEGFPLGVAIVSEKDKKRFIRLFGSILRLRNILRVFDEFEGKEILTPRELQNYQSVYLDIYQEMREAKSVDEKESIIDDVVFEVELIKQIEVNIDYILELVAKYHDDNCQNREILVSIGNAVDSSLDLRSKKDLILAFVDSLTVDSDVLSDWVDFVEERYLEELNQIICEENLNRREAANFMNEALMDGEIKTTGLGITKVLPPTPKFGKSGSFSEKKDRVIEKLSRLFERYYGIG